VDETVSRLIAEVRRSGRELEVVKGLLAACDSKELGALVEKWQLFKQTIRWKVVRVTAKTIAVENEDGMMAVLQRSNKLPDGMKAEEGFEFRAWNDQHPANAIKPLMFEDW
jgi:nitroimidazol reductase NimA-like FMN-containing flavoprotein (pyridoxamine 5'-phosphate oxidase superfamily)